MRTNFTFGLLFFSILLFGQNSPNMYQSAKSLGMGAADLTFEGVYGLLGNPAGISSTQNIEVIGNTYQPYFTEINQLNFGLTAPFLSGGIGINLSQFGIEAFKNQSISLSYGKKLLDNLNIGLRFGYYHSRIEKYKNQSEINFSLGLQTQLGKDLKIAASLFRPTKLTSDENETINTVLKIGGSYFPSSKINLVAELEKDLDYPLRFNGGLEYQFSKTVASRIGVRTAPAVYSFGICIKINNNIIIDSAIAYHIILGYSPGFSIIYRNKIQK